jgi:hypothetical protein
MWYIYIHTSGMHSPFLSNVQVLSQAKIRTSFLFGKVFHNWLPLRVEGGGVIWEVISSKKCSHIKTSKQQVPACVYFNSWQYCWWFGCRCYHYCSSVASYIICLVVLIHGEHQMLHVLLKWINSSHLLNMLTWISIMKIVGNPAWFLFMGSNESNDLQDQCTHERNFCIWLWMLFTCENIPKLFSRQ